LYVSVGDAGRLTSFSYDYIYDAVRSGELPAIKKGREWRIAVAELRTWMDKDRGGRACPPRSEMARKMSRYLPGVG
jgi:excisionase family DNA binding protein